MVSQHDLITMVDDLIIRLHQFGHDYARRNLHKLEKQLGGVILLPCWAQRCQEVDRLNDAIDYLCNIYARRYGADPISLDWNYAKMFSELVLKGKLIRK